ncbi:MAG: hypothetical protein NNA25_06665 [Nitrospira sp.]|nr:hypothetical protein [Nitrospira sp.]
MAVKPIECVEQAATGQMIVLGRLEEVVSTPEEFDRVVSQSLPVLLERTRNHTRRFLKEIGQWNEDTAHEKFVLRWSAEYLERFMVYGRSEVPCRPLFLLDSFVAKEHSRPEPFCYHTGLLTVLGRFLDGLVARAVVSRDALIALYHHCYGMGPRDVISVAGLTESESQRIYKNFRRWRESGWRRTMEEIGMTDDELEELAERAERSRQQLNHEAERVIRLAQDHYRKSEPDHYPCLSRREWEAMFSEGYGCDYRLWHLGLCFDCLQMAWGVGRTKTLTIEKPKLDIRVRP